MYCGLALSQLTWVFDRWVDGVLSRRSGMGILLYGARSTTHMGMLGLENQLGGHVENGGISWLGLIAGLSLLLRAITYQLKSSNKITST